MQPVVRPLILLHSDPDLRERLDEIPGQIYRLTRVAGWSALRSALRRVPPIAVAVVDPFAGTGVEGRPAEELRELLSDLPDATVLAALRVRPSGSAVLRTLLGWGVADFLALERETPVPALAYRLRHVQGRYVNRLLRRALPRGVPTRAQALLRTAAEVVSVGGGGADFAAALGVGSRTVPRRCERADLPPPKRLLAWLRLLLAAEMLDDRERSLAAAGRACGYSGQASLTSTIRSFFRCSPRELRDRGAFDTVARAFAAELARARDAAYARGRSEKVWLS